MCANNVQQVSAFQYRWGDEVSIILRTEIRSVTLTVFRIVHLHTFCSRPMSSWKPPDFCLFLCKLWFTVLFCSVNPFIIFFFCYTTIISHPTITSAVCVSHLAQGTHQLRRVMRVVESRGSQSFRKVRAYKITHLFFFIGTWFVIPWEIMSLYSFYFFSVGVFVLSTFSAKNSPFSIFTPLILVYTHTRLHTASLWWQRICLPKLTLCFDALAIVLFFKTTEGDSELIKPNQLSSCVKKYSTCPLWWLTMVSLQYL